MKKRDWLYRKFKGFRKDRIMKSKTITLFIFPVILIFFLFLSCGIESFEPTIDLKPPLGLTASNISNGILLEFWGLNDESYFEGYKIYIAESLNDLLQNKGGVLPNSDDPGKPTMPNIPPMTEATRFSYLVKNFTNNNQPLILSNSYFFYVKAYSAQYNIVGKPSNITNIQFLNLP